MIELFLSTDGKHTVHVAAETPEEMAKLTPVAKALYQKVLEEFGTKAQMWQSALNGQSKGYANGQTKSNGQAQADTTPVCPMHQKPMKYRQGRLGPFWSCATRKPNGEWCGFTQEAGATGNGQMHTA